MPTTHEKFMLNFTPIAITTENSRCLGQFPSGPAVPNPQRTWHRKRWVDFQRHTAPGRAGREQSSRSPGMLSTPGSGSTGTGSPCSYCRLGWCLLPASPFQTPPDSVSECFQPASLTANLWKRNTIWHLAPEKLPISALHSIIHKSKNWTAHVMYWVNAIFLFARTLASK